MFFSCSTDDGDVRAANRRQVETKKPESERREMLLEEVYESQDRVEKGRQAEIKGRYLGLITHGEGIVL